MLKQFLKKWLFLFIVIVFDLVIALKIALGFFFLIFWFLISVISLAFLWLVLVYFTARISIERHVTKQTREDDTVTIETVVKNKGGLPVFNLVLEDFLSPSSPEERKKYLSVDFLAAHSSLTLQYKCHCNQRGKYKIGPFRLYFFDPFSIFFFKQTQQVNSEIYVFPKTFPIKKFPPLLKGVFPWFGIETTHISGDDDDFYGIREYKEGDPVKMIHWISTARKNKLIVKEFQRQAFFRATLFFNLEAENDFRGGKESIPEYMIKIAASVTKYLAEKDISLEIIAHAQEAVRLTPNKGRAYLAEVFKFFSIAQPTSKVSLGEIFEEYSRQIPNDTTLIVIMQDRDWKYMPMLLALRKRNISLIPIILISSTFLYSFRQHEVIQDIKIKLSRNFNFTPILISRGDNLEEVFLRG